MPHDRKGRLVEVGDHVAFKDFDGAAQVGKVEKVYAGAETCNLGTTVLVPATVAAARTVTASEVDLVRKADGSEPEAAKEA